MSILLADIDATCAALGFSDGQRYQAEPDALQGLKHLIWILRRDLDNHEYRRHLGHAKVLQTDLVYMLPEYVDDDDYADVLIRLLVILTNPTLLLYRDGPPKDNHGRKVFLELIEILQGYKDAFTRDKIWTALFGKLKKSLEIDWALRSEEQSLLIERILVLIRNVLQVPANPEAECRADNDASVHDQVIWALHQAGLLDLVLFVLSSPDEHQFHLHALEILCLLYREQTAESLADASLQRSVSEKQRDEQELIAARRRERQRLTARPPPGRHSRFGGTYVIRNLKSVSDKDIICHQPLERVVAIDFDREKEQQRRSYRHVREEAQVTRRSAFSVRLCLREYCIEVLRSAYNTLVRQVRRVLERNVASANHDDDSYLLWAIRFFMEFNRLSGQQLQLVSESLSVQCFHWVLTRMQHDLDMMVSDKKQARLWAKRLHVALQTFRELLHSLLALQRLPDDNARALFDMLLNNVCYVLEYRETILHLLMNYNEAHSTKAFLRDVVETANIFMKMMEKFCQDSVVVQDKKRAKRGTAKKAKKSEKPQPETEEQLANRWVEMATELTEKLSNELQLAEEEQPIPFDSTSEKSIDDQKEDCMIRIHRMLRTKKLDQAVALMRAAREVWPENDVFGAMSAAPEDELLLLREIFMHNIATVEDNKADEEEEGDGASDDEENEEYGDNDTTERAFKFEDFAKRLLNPRIVRACTVVLTDWQHIPTKSLKAAVTILHRIAYGCSCPAMLYQAKLFRIFQQVLHAARDPHHEELRRLGVYVVRKFVEVAPTNPKIYAELLFYKNIKEANELENGYCDAYESGTRGTWSEEQEAELRFLFEENQRNPQTEQDVIDWILDNLIDKTRTRRGVLKKLKELGLQFKAPTKRSTASVAGGRNLWRPDEDDELRRLYDEHRTEEDCLQRIQDEFDDHRNKQQIIKRMLQLHIIADKSEVLPQKPRKPKSKKRGIGDGVEDRNGDVDYPEEGSEFRERSREAKMQQRKPRNETKAGKRKIVRTPLDVGTVKALLLQVDRERYQESIDWLHESLSEAADDTDEAAEEDDGVPLVPIQEVQRQAMEDDNFRKVLVALGMQPPIVGTENYWRIPIYLNSADLKLRAKIVKGEDVEEDGGDAGALENGNDSDNEDYGGTSGHKDENEESEEDYLDNHLARWPHQQLDDGEDYMTNRRKKMRTLMFSKSDEEAEERPPLKGRMKKRKEKKREAKLRPKENDGQDTLESENDKEPVNRVMKRKMDKKKRKVDASDEEDGDKSQLSIRSATTDDLFDQLKIEGNTSKLSKVLSANGDSSEASDNELDFNSEDYRRRLAELSDSDDEADGKENEAVSARSANGARNYTRRANVIESESDGDDDNGDNDGDADKDVDGKGRRTDVDGAVEQQTNNRVLDGDDSDGNGSADTVDADDANDVDGTSSATNKKRRRSRDLNTNDVASHKGGKGADEEEDVDFVVRRRVSNSEQALIASGEKPPKRRRTAVIEDDDDDDDDDDKDNDL